MKNIIAGNWKMNMRLADIDEYFSQLTEQYNNIDFSNREVLIAPPYIYFSYIKEIITNRKLNIKLGLQNCFYKDSGAFTGEISAAMAMDVGADFVIVGHSERRHIFGEDNTIINKKLQAVLSKGLTAILCIGETLEEREAGETEKVLEAQLSTGLKDISQFEDLIVAYEPVWAIGTGKTASVEQIEGTHNFIENFLKKNIAKNIPILYGGSVKPENINEIMNINNVNGVLVGGASLKFEKFYKIINFDKEK